MFYLLVALINAIYGIMFLAAVTPDTPGYLVMAIIGLTLTVIGLSGIYYFIRKITKKDELSETNYKNWFSLARSFDLVLILGIVFRLFILQPYIVEGNSMEPNFHQSEAILVDKISYRFKEVEAGEVIVFRAPNNSQDDYIKRVIGVPGDTIKIEQGQVFVNGKKINQEFLSKDSLTLINSSLSESLTKTLKQDEYFVLGDNRDHSSDSREWGVVPQINIVGRAFIVVYPLDQISLIKPANL